MNKLFKDSDVLKLHRLTEKKEGDMYIVGRNDTEVFVKVPVEGFYIIQLIKNGFKIEAIKKKVSQKYRGVDVHHFITDLVKHGFIAQIGSRQFNEQKKQKKHLFSFIRPSHVKWLFSYQMYIIYSIILVLALMLLIKNPQYFPRERDYFFTNIYTLLIPISFALAWLLVSFHEFAHYLAARSKGIKASFGIANKLRYIVVETDVTDVWKVDRKHRYRVFLAGMTSDLLIASICIILLWLKDFSYIFIHQFFYNFLKFIILIELWRIIWQFMFFIRTDVYYVFENLAKMNYMHRKAKLYLHNLFSKMFKKMHHVLIRYDSDREKGIVKLYSIFFLLGVVINLAVFFSYQIPITFQMVGDALNKINIGVKNFAFYDSVVLVIFIVLNFLLLGYGIIQHHTLKRKSHYYWLALVLFTAANYFMVYFLVLLVSEISTFLFYLAILLFGLVFGIFYKDFIERIEHWPHGAFIELFFAVIASIFSFCLMNAPFALHGLDIKVIAPVYICGILIVYASKLKGWG